MLQRLIILLAMLMLPTLATLAQPSSAFAATEYNLQIPFSDDFSSCSGELVAVDGIQHIVGRAVEDANGRLHFGFTRHTQGTGIGYSSGSEYLLIDSVTRASLQLTNADALIFTQQYHSLLIRKGEGASTDDSIVHMLTHFVITPDGDLTALVEFSNAECR